MDYKAEIKRIAKISNDLQKSPDEFVDIYPDSISDHQKPIECNHFRFGMAAQCLKDCLSVARKMQRELEDN